MSVPNESKGMIDDPKKIRKMLCDFVYNITQKNGFKGAIEAVQPVTAIKNFKDILKSDEETFSCACYAVWGFCVSNLDYTLSEDMKIKVGNFLDWANIVLSDKRVLSDFADSEIFPYFPRTVEHYQIGEEGFNYIEIAEVMERFFPTD